MAEESLVVVGESLGGRKVAVASLKSCAMSKILCIRAMVLSSDS